VADLALKDGPHQLAAQVRKLSVIDWIFWLRMRAFSGPVPIEQTTVEDFRQALCGQRARSLLFWCSKLLPIMCKDSSITLVSSLAAYSAVANLSAYAATKGAVCDHGQALCIGARPRVFESMPLLPGVVETEMSSF